ncbi:MAG: Rrf2 family transcriptional regulator [Alphaproteobacteria bacterium]|nr:Rrf2 family transcriptional regulator [Alphaproteobacteria bacterium]
MRISTKGRHAVMAMVDLARNGQDKPVSLAGIAERQGVSLSYLEQLVARLKMRGLVKSMRGPGGGYMLASPSNGITVNEIVQAVDEEAPRIVLHEATTATVRQLTDLLWQAVGDEISEYLKTITLDDVNKCSLCTNGNGLKMDLSGVLRHGETQHVL